MELVRELPIERRNGVVSIRDGEGDDGGVGKPGEGIEPEFQHAFPRTVIDDLQAREPGDRIDDRRRLPRCQGVLALQYVHDFRRRRTAG